MGRFVKTGKRSVKAISTSSLPDIVFMILFFFMAVTTMRERRASALKIMYADVNVDRITFQQ